MPLKDEDDLCGRRYWRHTTETGIIDLCYPTTTTVEALIQACYKSRSIWQGEPSSLGRHQLPLMKNQHMKAAQVCSRTSPSLNVHVIRLFFSVQPVPTFYHPEESHIKCEDCQNCCFNIKKGTRRDHSLVKESPEKRLPQEVTFIRGSYRQGDDGLFLIPASHSW